MKYIETHLIEIASLLVAIISLVVGYFALIVPISQYINQKELEESDKRFKNYHKLIEDLVAPKDPYVDRQIAVVFELRKYPEYFEVTKRILEGLKQTWSLSPLEVGRLLKEIDLTLDFIEAS